MSQNRNQVQPVIDSTKPTSIGILGKRGGGKSVTLERIAVGLYLEGWTILDLFAMDNLENAYYCIGGDKLMRIPITLIAPKNLIFSQEQIDIYNGKRYSKDEYREILRKQGIVEFPKEMPLKPTSEHREWVRIEQLDIPTPKHSEVNEKISQEFIKIVLDARKQRRIIVLNLMLFNDEYYFYKLLEVMIRTMKTLRNTHFRKPTPEMFGKSSYADMTNIERNHNKIGIVIRELGEVCPSKLKGDEGGFSTFVKKAMLQLGRKVRHYQISLIADWQNFTDVDSGVRSQFDVWIIKRWNFLLSSKEWIWAFMYVQNMQKYYKEHFSFQGAKKKIKAYCPSIENLGYSEAYVPIDTTMKKIILPHPITAHKEADDDWGKSTGIWFNHNKFDKKEMVRAGLEGSDEKNQREITLVNEIVRMKNDKKKRTDIITELINKQKSGKIFFEKDISAMKPNSFTQQIKRLAKKHQIIIPN